MVDICCLCGDVGFSDKLFRCSRCRHRFQHSYCSNYYLEDGGVIEVCDWCGSNEKNMSSRNIINSKSGDANETRSAYSGGRVKQPEKATGKLSSPRPTVRRFKLLKDVMC